MHCLSLYLLQNTYKKVIILCMGCETLGNRREQLCVHILVTVTQSLSVGNVENWQCFGCPGLDLVNDMMVGTGHTGLADGMISVSDGILAFNAVF